MNENRLYDLNDMVKANCMDCKGCSQCCEGMGNSIILDPFDVYQLCGKLGASIEGLLGKQALELNIVKGLILPNMKMTGDRECCSFLDQEGRCSIHSIRPGICRLFPLGRQYDDGRLQYFIVEAGCPRPDKAKVKVKKWIDVPNEKQYQQFVIDWHYFKRALEERIAGEENDQVIKAIDMLLLKQFFLSPYEQAADFYSQFYMRLTETKQALGIM